MGIKGFYPQGGTRIRRNFLEEGIPAPEILSGAIHTNPTPISSCDTYGNCGNRVAHGIPAGSRLLQGTRVVKNSRAR